MKKLVSLFCAIALIFSLVTVSSASAPLDPDSRADALNALGLFQGTGTGYALDGEVTRAQGVVMLIRLLGKEAESKFAGLEHPFKDNVPGWASPQIAYAFHNGLANGVDLTPGQERFDPSSLLNAAGYVTLLLRSLGYSDAAGDYNWRNSVQFAVSLGLITESGAQTLSDKKFTRADLVDLSYAALSCTMKDSEQTLGQFLAESGVFSADLGAKWISSYSYGLDKQWAEAAASAVKHELRTVSTSAGDINAHILQIDISNPYVEVKQVLSGQTIHDTLSFAKIVEKAQANNALAVITSNFRLVDNPPYYPIGHVMADGEILFTSTYSTLGITADREMRYGRPSLSAWVKPLDEENPRKHWQAYSINVAPTGQSGNTSVLYTHAFGDSVEITMAGTVTTVRNDVVTDYSTVAPGDIVSIPSDGYLLLLSPAFEKLYLFKAPVAGQPVELIYQIKNPDAEGFTVDDMMLMVSGSPRLVQNGEIYTELDPTFSGARFSPTYKAPRTAVGTTADGILILVSVPSATIQQMRELMLNLGCVNAINLDGGGSTGFYYDGTTYYTPSRELITTLQIYVNTPQ